MEKGKYANLTTGQLHKRIKFASILLWIFIAAVVLDISALIYNLIIGKGFNNVLFVTAATCMVISLPMIGRCPCTQGKFVMVVAPGHAHLHTIKILHRDNFLAKVPGLCPDAASGNTISLHCRAVRHQRWQSATNSVKENYSPVKEDHK